MSELQPSPMTIAADTDIDAFPVPKGADTAGMSLRDWFAGRIITGLYSKYGVTLDSDEAFDNDAKTAYRIADAMLRARIPPEADGAALASVLR